MFFYSRNNFINDFFSNVYCYIVSFVFTDVTQKYTITHNTTAFAILGTKQNNIKTVVIMEYHYKSLK